MIAQELALNHPRMVEKIILSNTTCGGIYAMPPRLNLLKRFSPRAVTMEEQVLRSIEIILPEDFIENNPETVKALLDSAMKAPPKPADIVRQAVAVARFSSYSRLPEIRVPALVLTGTRDILIPPQNSWVLSERIPDSSLRLFEGGGHGFIHQYPSDVAAVLNEFLAD
jgi:pimeloyl-ACP methyl ester carboxylesterase